MVVSKVKALGLVGIMAGSMLMPTVALADGHHREGGFTGLSQYPWARAAILLMAKQGVLKGEGNGHFGGKGYISREQLAAVVARLRAWSVTQSAPPGQTFKDWGRVASWAKADIRLAVAHGIFKGNGNGDFQAHHKVTWAQLAVVLARTLKLPLVPTASVSTTLANVPNAQNIPSWAKEGVARLVAANILSGTVLQQFQPNMPVMRASLALLITNAETWATAHGATAVIPVAKNGLFIGTISSVSSSSMLLTLKNGKQLTVPISATTQIVVNGSVTSSSALTDGMGVMVAVTGGQAAIITNASVPTSTTATGTLFSITPGTNGAASTITLGVQGSTQTFTIPANASITLNGSPVSITALTPGETITVTEGTTTTVSATGTPSLSSTISGTYVGLVGSNMVVTQSTNGTVSTGTYTLASGYTVSLNGTSSTLANVATGDQVVLGLDSTNQVVSITATGSGTSAA